MLNAIKIAIILLFLTIFEGKVVRGNDDWWKTASFYQIYPRSFQDSDGDGIGDLNGITNRLSYLKEIGITAVWLSPIFESPMADFGYDISNFYEIDKIFGTMKDFENLIEIAKKLDLKIILDFVPNHTSDQNEWFKKSIIKDKEFKDFYVWHPGSKDKNGKPVPPSNWKSIFWGNAWKWHEKRGEFYLHQFLTQQPDLNYRNKKVHEKMADVLKFWLGKGVDGFRIDAVPYIYECPQTKDGKFVDEARNLNITDENDYDYLIHNCTIDQPETIELVYEWRKILDDYKIENKTDSKVLLAEIYSPIDIIMKFYTNGTHNGAHVPFNFDMITRLTNESTAVDFTYVLKDWLKRMNQGRIPNWVLGNHDKSRVGSRFGSDRIDMFNIIGGTLPGISVTYQGEEIGMTDVWISWKDTIDPWACNSNPDIYEKLSRDPVRTPFQWSDTENAGFSTNKSTWLPISQFYKTVNVKRQRQIGRSHLNIYKNLRMLRNDKVFKQNFQADVKALNRNVLAILRTFEERYFITLANLKDNVEFITLSEHFKELPKEFRYVIVTQYSSQTIGKVITAENIIVLLPKESVVLQSVDEDSG